jgi:hypothetical protein
VLTYSSGGAPVAAGPHTVNCDYAATNNYTASTATATITITRKAASVTAGSGTKVFGTADPTLAATSTGFLAADGITVHYAGRDAGENVGGYATHAGAAGDALTNYDVTYTDGELTITPAATMAVATGGTFVYDGLPHGGTCVVTAVAPAPGAASVPPAPGGPAPGAATPPSSPSPAPAPPSSSAPPASAPPSSSEPPSGSSSSSSASSSSSSSSSSTTTTTTPAPADSKENPEGPAPTPSSGTFASTISYNTVDGNPPVNAGTYTITCTTGGDGNHTGSTSTATITIEKAPSVTVVTCSATTVFNGSAQELCTAHVTGAGDLDADVTPVTYTTNTDAGTAGASATYGGDANHTPSTGTSSFEITKAPSVTVVTCPVSVGYTGSALTPCTANVTGIGGLDTGVTPVTHTDNTNVGTANATATFTGDANHEGSTGNATFEITQAATATAINAPTITVAANGLVTVTVTSGSGVVVGNVSLTVDGGAAVTQPLVNGSSVFTVASPDAGDHALVATYAAQNNFSASSATGTLHVNPSPTATTLTTSATPQLAGTPVTFTATVVATTPGSGTPNGVVTFLEGTTVLGTGALDGSGVATFTTSTLSNGPHTITASYNGVNNYLPSDANTVSKLIFGLASGGGTFVIGDNNATLNNQVMFWGAQWEKNNSMTGGSSNNSFKGYAISPAVPTVGAMFTSAPGNSAPPPAGVPQYVGIIVTSKVTKSGSNITGTIVKLVVVKVDPGYQGNPGHAGTGKIVAFVQ